MISSLPHGTRRAVAGGVCALFAALSGAVAAAPQSANAVADAPLPHYDHIVIVVLENRSAEAGDHERIWGNPVLPVLNELADDPAHGARFTNAWASETPYRQIPKGFQAPLSARPSQPNYLYLFSASHQGVLPDWFLDPTSGLSGHALAGRDGDRLPVRLDDVATGIGNRRVPPQRRPFSTANLGATLREAGRSFLTFSESLPYPGWDESGDPLPTLDLYRRKHNPALNWIPLGAPNATASVPPDRQRFLLPVDTNLGFEPTRDPQGRRWRGFVQDSNGRPLGYEQLPTVALVVPNEQHDAHSASLTEADAWLRTHIAPYARWATQHNSLLIVTFDEDGSTDRSQGDPYRWGRHRIATFFHGAHVKPGVYGERIDALNVLATVLHSQGLLARFRTDFEATCPDTPLSCRLAAENLRPVLDAFGVGPALTERPPVPRTP